MATQLSPRFDLSDAVTNCDYGNQADVVELITSPYTPLFYEDAVLTKIYQDPRSLANSILDTWGRETFQYGQGAVPTKEIYSPSYVPRGRQFLTNDDLPRPDEINTATDNLNLECVLCYIDVPTGGISRVQGQFLRADYMTAPVCARTIASSRAYWDYAGRLMQDRMMVEQTTMINFFNVVLQATSGYKILLETGHPDANLSARALTAYPQTYGEEQFPKVYDPEAVQPLTFAFLQTLALTAMYEYQLVKGAVETDNGPIWTLISDFDWYNQNIGLNPQWSENLRWTAPGVLFQGFNPGLVNNVSEVNGIGNWRFQTRGELPRYTYSAAVGGVVEVQPFVTINQEIGVEPVRNPAWRDAPFGVAYVVTKTQAKLLTQPELTLSSGISVPNLQGGGANGVQWQAFNPYDPLCNPEQNLPRWKMHFRMGFMQDEYYTAFAILYRRTQPVYPETPLCSPYPIVCEDPTTETCEDINGPCGGRETLSPSITKTVLGDEVRYSATACGGTRYVRARVDFVPNRPNGVITAACGSTVNVFYSDGTQDVGTILDTSWAAPSRPYDEYFIDLGSGNSIPAGECITLLQDLDGTVTVATIIACVSSDVCEELEANQVKIFTDHALVGSLVTVFVTGSDGTTDVVVTVADSDPEQGWYIIEAVGLDCADGGGLEGGTFNIGTP